MTELSCKHEQIFSQYHSAAWLCNEVADKVCGETQQMVNFFELYWCELDGKTWILILIALFLIFVIFKYTSITVEEYIAEGIQNISEKLGLSEAVAAITLLAFANGAGDVITALVASDSEGGVSYNIGSLYGAGLFVASCVVAICILQSPKPLVFDKMIIYRDVGFYIIATLMTMFFAYTKWITWWSSLMLLGLYFVLVIFVVVHDNSVEEKVSSSPNLIGEILRITAVPGIDLSSAGTGMKEMLVIKDIVPHDMEINHQNGPKDGGELEQASERKLSRGSSGSQEKIEYQEDEAKEVGTALADLMLAASKKYLAAKSMKLDSTEEYAGMIGNLISIRTYASRLKLKMNYVREQRRRDKSIVSPMEAFGHMIALPFHFMLYFTALPAEKDEYSRSRAMTYPIPGMLFMSWIIYQELTWKWLSVGLAFGLILQAIFYYALPKEEKEAPSWFTWMTVLSVISGLMWTYLLIGLMIDLLNAFGIILNIDNTYLGLTILAIGNALPDALTTIALCKQGLGVLALSGGYAGQLFGFLVGFGISMLKLTLKDGPQPFDLFDMSKLNENFLSLLVVLTAFLTLGSTFIFGIMNNFVMTKPFAIYLIVIYVTFVVIATIETIAKAMHSPA